MAILIFLKALQKDSATDSNRTNLMPKERRRCPSSRLGCVNFWIFGVFSWGSWKNVNISFRVARKKIYRNINSTLVYGVFYRSNNPEARRDWPLLIHGGCNDKKFVAFFLKINRGQ